MTQTDAQHLNLDADEIAKFNALASRWWDPDGDFRPLHDINPTRLGYIQDRSKLSDGPAIDVGCGGGILTEALAETCNPVTGIDMAEKALGVARLHALEHGREINYLCTTAEQHAQEHAAGFRTVTCLEMLEHVQSYPSTVRACADMCVPGGDVFFSTINRNARAYAILVIGAEYLLKLLPRGTHDYAKFIRPSELCSAITDAGLEICDISGLSYNPFSRKCRIVANVDTNYIVHAHKPS